MATVLMKWSRVRLHKHLSRGSLTVVAAMDEHKTVVAPRSVITNLVLDVEHLVDSKITENIELVSVGIKLLQNLVWITMLSMTSFQSSQ